MYMKIGIKFYRPIYRLLAFRYKELSVIVFAKIFISVHPY